MDYKGILTYEDTTLYETELKLFKEPRWLNDNCISFYLDYLQNTIIGKEEIFESKITVLHPSTVSWTIFETDFEDIEDQLFPLKLGIRDYWIIPLNDNQNKLLPGQKFPICSSVYVIYIYIYIYRRGITLGLTFGTDKGEEMLTYRFFSRF